MNTRSKYHPLKYVVECKWPSNAYWETIAAMNHDDPAIHYAGLCQQARKILSYRVLERKGSGAFVEIWPEDKRK